VAIFTIGLRPEDEDGRSAFIAGASSHLAVFGLSATEAFERTKARSSRFSTDGS
jgi:hypothetical protein